MSGGIELQAVTTQATGERAGQMSHHAKIGLAEFLMVAIQLGVLALVIRQFEIESRAFLRLALLAFGGFAVHAFLPLRSRLPFFLMLSFAAIGLVFGPVNGAWLVGIGLVLIGICHLPVSFRARAGLLLAIGAGLAVMRADWLSPPWPQALWPILGSMFMFRLIVYLYDLSNEKAPFSVWRTLSYFFLLPNVCFPLFPVVDYKTFRRTYYDGDPYQIYQRGVDWMSRGLLQLILYRVVYYYFTLAPTEVTTPAALAQYMLSTFLLYLRISGQFHLVVGMLHLFGFHLPETHHRYLLASSFTDFWRRINIYWKDFMLKVFYYPAFFRLRRWGTTTALVASTLYVFVATWILHSYQWFWLRGSFPITWLDGIFWGVLGLLVVANTFYEERHGRRRALGVQRFDPRRAALMALRTVGTFCAICILWSLWTAESLSAWLSLWMGLGPVAAGGTQWIPTVVVLGGVLGWTLWGELQRRPAAAAQAAPRHWARGTATAGALLLLGVVALYPVYSQFPAGPASLIHTLRAAGLSRVDNARMERGYYEALLRVDRFNGQLWQVYMSKPVKGLDGFEGAHLLRFTGDFMQKELIPSFASATPYGTIRTNRWGMRDQDYSRERPPNTHRVALLGASSVMGWGVGDDGTFEAILETRLNRERAGAPYERYEILNFSVAGYQPLQQAMMLGRAIAFQPHAVIYVATGREPDRSAFYLAEAVRNRLEIPYPYLREVVQRAQLTPGMEETAAVRRLEPYRHDLLAWLYRDIVARCRALGILPVWMLMPLSGDRLGGGEDSEVQRMAEEAGFLILKVSDAFANEDPRNLRLAEWDSHPNARAHQLIADRMYRALLEKEGVFFVPAARHARR